MPIPDDDPLLDEHTERELAKRLFNLVWDLLDQPSRTVDQDDLMANAAHASLYHWIRVGEPVNEARGEWQVSRVYSVLHRGEPALHHAQRSLALCEQHGIGDFDLAFAYEGALSGSHGRGRRGRSLQVRQHRQDGCRPDRGRRGPGSLPRRPRRSSAQPVTLTSFATSTSPAIACSSTIPTPGA